MTYLPRRASLIDDHFADLILDPSSLNRGGGTKGKKGGGCVKRNLIKTHQRVTYLPWRASLIDNHFADLILDPSSFNRGSGIRGGKGGYDPYLFSLAKLGP